MLKAAPDGFTVTERAGDAQVVLTRDFNGEKITIAFECTQDGEEFIDDDEELDEEMDEEGMQGMEEVSGRGVGAAWAGAARADPGGAQGDEEERDSMEFIGMEYADFNVHIVKGDEILTVECVADIGGYTISRVMMEDPNLESDVIAYTGPEFATLDEELQESFVQYLEERGVNSAMGAWIVVMASDKEDREYATWLDKVKAFVTKS